MRVAETVAALCVTLLGVTTIVLARQMAYDAEYGPGPGFLPFWLGVALVILSVFLLRSALRIPASNGAAAVAEDGAPASRFFQFAPDALVPWLVFFVSTIGLAVFFERLGFGLAIGLYMLLTMRWVAGQSWAVTIVLTIVTPLVLYLGFVRLLMVPLPLLPPGV